MELLKLNFDGSVLHNNQASAGFVIRDSQGTPILASAKDIGHSSVVVAEAMALREGLRQAICIGHSHIIVEGDSNILIDSISGISPIPWRIKFLVQDIGRFASRCSQISFVHIWREANFVADAIAKAGHSLNISVWENSLPLCAANAFHFDQLGCGCPRGSSL